ncbi:hypothetical protein NV226_02435 [Mycoplasma iguanae]|uniref:Uncharacterized protein n=1 Tax=Mycoplasma iguanae TaxID=292461 RepID=A0ABY5R7S7_9MOLU|nr:hypothetical protein [Mycoplasma iguanae]UVD81563.1 hypothetical protein NV226_02435 [Mycoplasma iguanae]
MIKKIEYYNNLINKIPQQNNLQIQQLKHENHLIIEKCLDKVLKKSIFYQDKNNYLQNKINKYQDDILNLKSQKILNPQLNFDNKMQKLNFIIEKLETKLTQQKNTLNLRLEAYSKKIKFQIEEFKKNNQIEERKLQEKIDSKNQKFFESQNQKFSDYRNQLIKIENQYQLESKKIASENNQKINNLNSSNEVIYQKQLQLLDLELHQSLKSLETKYSKLQKKIYQKIKVFNFLNNFKNSLFYQKADKTVYEWIFRNKLIFLILIFAIVVGSIYPRFFHYENWLSNILQQNIAIGFLSLGMTFIILTGSIDLSVGSTMALSGGLTLYLYSNNGIALGWAIILGLLIALALSGIMGFLSSYGKLQSFIVTLVGLLVFRGILNTILAGSPVTVRDSAFINYLGNGYIGEVGAIVIIFVIVTLILIFILKWTKLGRYVYATGSNKNAAKASGIKTKLIITLVFIISGLMIYFGTLAYIGNVRSIEPQTANGYELSAIAAVVLGGTSLTGGKGSIGKTIIGWLLISILNNALVFLRVDSNMQLVFRGIIILLAVLFDKQFNFVAQSKNLLVKIRGY